MPVRQIEEAEFLANQELVRLVADILNNTEARNGFLKSKKIVRPNEPVPEFDAAAPLNKRIDELQAEIAADRKAQADAAAAAEAARKVAELQSSWDKQKSALRDRGYLTNGIDEIEKFAFDRGIPDLEAAAALYEKLHPPSAPNEPVGRGFFDSFIPTSPEEDSDMKKLLETRGQSEGLLNKMIGDALREVRSPHR